MQAGIIEQGTAALVVKARLCGERQPEIGRISAQRVAVESRRGDADDRVRLLFDGEGRAEDGWILGKVLKPNAVAHDRDRGSTGGVVAGTNHASGVGV